MYSIEITSFNNNNVVQKANNTFDIKETFNYNIILRREGIVQNGFLLIDGVFNQFGEQRTIALGKEEKTPFINCFGLFTCSYDGQFIATFDVSTTKLSGVEAKNILEYVYHNSQELFTSNLNKTRNFTSGGSTKNNLSLFNYIGVIKELLACLKSFLPILKNKALYKIRKEITIERYEENCATSKSLEWILANLDKHIYGNSLKGLPGAFEIDGTFALPNQIEIEKNIKDFSIYENKIIIGAIKTLELRIRDTIYLVKSNIEDNDIIDEKFASFNTIKKILLSSELNNLAEAKHTLYELKNNYFSFFNTVPSIQEKPKLTHNFRRKKHYRNIYEKVRLLYDSSLLPTGIHLVLGIKNIDILYEYYVFYKIIDLFKQLYGEPTKVETEEKEQIIKYVEFINEQGMTFRVHYQLRINKEKITPSYPWLKLFVNSNTASHYTPDIVVEFEFNSVFNYAIFDAKYSTKKWIEGTSVNIGNTTQTVINKYYLSVSHRGEPYKKIDYLFLVYPSRISAKFFTKETDYYPIIAAIPSVPNNNSHLQDIIETIARNWANNTQAHHPKPSI
ncbi:hypothetical protein [Desulfotalea psychrophila]|uniref:DUF2357 domain-containing protein n=1 Tax=Desulfotalea psychrophila (strain LSv54 / DSM 12343) TaxID=177439 RepID=Q6AKL4_DESPS|nr:hypothetical protein [Desulfotalea psychrophila]CAG37111.1 unknown protein [Desulfotalea psychrophila LSv54]